MEQNYGAVSYTHLDVYKRQVWTLVNRQPGARRINQVTMGLLLLQLMHYTECIDMSRNCLLYTSFLQQFAQRALDHPA